MNASARPAIVVGALLAALATAGCVKAPPPVELVPQGQPLAIGDARVVSVLAAHARRTEARQGLTGAARVALSGPDFKLNRPQRIALERPARLRFEILGLFDQLLAILVTDRVRYGFFDASTGEVERGRVSPALLLRLTKIDLSPEELVGLLLAAPRPESGTLRAGAWLEPTGRLAVAFAWPVGRWGAGCETQDPLLDLGAADCDLPDRALAEAGGQIFFFDAAGELAEVRAFDPGAVVRYRVRFEAYAPLDPADEAVFPQRVTLESPGNASEARFDWKRVRFASELADTLFRLPEPRRAGAGG